MMFDWTYRKRLKEDLEIWVKRGWVSAEGAANILLDQYPADGRSRLPLALAGIGMVCVALAVFAFIAANWGAIPKLVKLSGIAVMVLASHFAAAHAASRGRQGVADLLTGFATLVFVGGLALVGQIFHLPADWPGGAFLVCLGGLAAAWLTGARAGLVVAVAAALVWQVSRAEPGEATLVQDLTGLALLAAVFAHAMLYPASLSRWLAVSLTAVSYGRWFADTVTSTGAPDGLIVALGLFGAGGLGAVMMLADPVADLIVKWSSDLPARKLGHWLMGRSLQNAGFLVLSGLTATGLIFFQHVPGLGVSAGLLQLPALLPFGLALVLLVVGLLLSFKTAKAAAMIGITGLALGAVVMPVLTRNHLVLAVFAMAALVGLCGLATWVNNRFWMVCAYLGLTAVAVWLLYETIGSLLGQSVFFLAAGALLLVLALGLGRMIRKGGTEPRRQEAGQ